MNTKTTSPFSASVTLPSPEPSADLDMLILAHGEDRPLGQSCAVVIDPATGAPLEVRDWDPPCDYAPSSTVLPAQTEAA